MGKITVGEFVERAEKIHGDTYDYSQINFVDYHTPVEIICKKEGHGIFKLKPKSHIYDKTRCPKCTKPGKGNLNWFLEKAERVHGHRYDYSKVNYVNGNTKVDIICKVDGHGVFNQTPNLHLNAKNGCPKCAGSIKSNSIEFAIKANKVHNNRYNYEKVNYIGNKAKVEIICDVHGSFWQTVGHHLNGFGCSKCSNRFSGDTEYFIKRANGVHNNLYDYSKAHYSNNKVKINIICNFHGTFRQTPHDHLQGHGCPKCVHHISKVEIAWLDFLGVPVDYRNKTLRLDGRKLVPDAVDIDNKIVWEFYGDWWHGNPKIYKAEDINPTSKMSFGKLYEKTLEKEEIYKKYGYKIISIWETDWKKMMKEKEGNNE